MIQYETLKIDPAPVVPDFHPTVEDVVGGEAVDQFGNHTALEFLVDGEAVQAARNAERTQKRHQQCSLGVALTVTVLKYLGRRNLVIPVVTERNFVANEGVGLPDLIEWLQCAPSSCGHQVVNPRRAEVKQACLRQISLFHVFRHSQSGRDVWPHVPMAVRVRNRLWSKAHQGIGSTYSQRPPGCNNSVLRASWA